METVLSSADRYGEIGIILGGVVLAGLFVWFMFWNHQRDCDSKNTAVQQRFEEGDARMARIETDVAVLKTDVSHLKKDMAELKADVKYIRNHLMGHSDR